VLEEPIENYPVANRRAGLPWRDILRATCFDPIQSGALFGGPGRTPVAQV